MTMLELMDEINPDAMKFDGFDDAIVGVVERFGIDPVLLYDWQKCVQIMLDRGCDDEFEAEEYLDFNVLGAWIGDGTPCFTNRYSIVVSSTVGS